MSNNNGVYVLATAGPEYRVAYTYSIDNIYGDYDYVNGRWVGDVDKMIDHFGDSKVYNDLFEAMDAAENYADELEDKGIVLEDAVLFIGDFKDMKFGLYKEEQNEKTNEVAR